MVKGNVAIAFGMVIGAGAATLLGACFVFVGKQANRLALAGSLGEFTVTTFYIVRTIFFSP